MAQNELNIIVYIKALMYETTQEELSSPKESCEFNIFDRTALECGFRLRNEFGGRVDVLSIGTHSSVRIMRETLAMGADRAVLLSDPALERSDSPTLTRALSATIKSMMPFDLLLFCSSPQNDDIVQVESQVTNMIDIPLITDIHSIVRVSYGLQIQCKKNHVWETCETSLPAALAITPEVFKSRDTGMFGIAAALEDLEVDILTLSDLDLEKVKIKPEKQEKAIASVIALPTLTKGHNSKTKGDKTAKQTDELIQYLHTI
ncbi:MAG: hypothetical protein PVI90_07255 [Desulfobacteraceae bacterium]|jgi:electron transfer flavoprotein beta subunit